MNAIKNKSADIDYSNLEMLLGSFDDGAKRFRESAIFHNVISELNAGAHPLSVIDRLLLNMEELAKAYSEYIKGDTRPPVVVVLDENKIEQLRLQYGEKKPNP